MSRIVVLTLSLYVAFTVMSTAQQDVPLSGTGLAEDCAALTVSPNPVTFSGTPIGESATVNLVLANETVTKTCVLDNVTFSGPDAAAFVLGPNAPIGAAVLPGTALSLPIVFTPTHSGPHAATLTID